MRRTTVCLSLILLISLFSALSSAAVPPTAEEARAFVEEAEANLYDIWLRASHAAWVQNTYIIHDTQILAAEAQKEALAATVDYAKQAARFDGLDLPEDVARKLKLLKLGTSLPVPADPAEQKEVTDLQVAMESTYGKGQYCRPGEDDNAECLDITKMERILAENRNPKELLELWQGWRKISVPMRPQYQRFVELANKGAGELGYEDLGAMWRSNYDMSPEDFSAELDRLWQQLRPLYLQLHAHVRARLSEKYGADIVPPEGSLPAHLLGNLWAQSWIYTYPLVAPPTDDPGFDLTEILQSKDLDEKEMVRYGERFFTSLGLDPLPDTFWERSLFTKPRDRDVVCHASAWDVDSKEDLRIKMCIQVNDEDFRTIHHELGHNFYQRAYNQQPFFFQGSANDGFHEALGDTISLSVTPEYLQQIDLLDTVPSAEGDLGLLMKKALDKIAFFPFALVVDKWRWMVFAGEIQPEDYNKAWWELRQEYQGVVPPVERTEEDFDPGAKFHIPGHVPYTRYFLAHVLQFQFHRALCREAGWEGPLHRCSIYDNKQAGEKLKKMMAMGQSRPWPEALEALTGEKRMDATAIVDYFAPLLDWLKEQNKGRSIGF
jgi:peptidyl-dipeptidase A